MLVITVQALHIGYEKSRYLILVTIIQISYVGINHPGISCWASRVSYIIQVLHVQVSHVGINNLEMLC